MGIYIMQTNTKTCTDYRIIKVQISSLYLVKLFENWTVIKSTLQFKHYKLNLILQYFTIWQII